MTEATPFTNGFLYY